MCAYARNAARHAASVRATLVSFLVVGVALFAYAQLVMLSAIDALNALTVILFAILYLAVGVAFPNPSAPGEAQFMWRLAAWFTCGVAFALHIAFEHVRFREPPRRVALHAAIAVALGALGLAGAANIHRLTAGTGNKQLLALALVLWPIITGVPAFVVALAAAAGLARLRSMRQRRRTCQG